MKKFFCLMAMAIAAVTFTACSESDSEAVFSVDPSVSEGIVAELDGGFYKIPITANQGWSARLEDGCNWASLSDAEGKGSGSIEVCVDANYTGTGRKTNVLISSGDKVVTVPVSQRTPDENDEDFYNIAQNKGLGYGFDLSSFKNGEVMIFNLKAIQKLVEQDELEYDGMFTSDVINDFMADDIHVDSVEEKADTLGVSLRMNINYGLFHLGVKAYYQGTEERKTYSSRYKVVQSAPMLNSKINYMEILSHYRNWVAEGCPEKLQDGETKDYRKNLLQNTAKALLDGLENAKDEDTMKKKAQAIYSTLGPAFISGTTLGGSVTMQLYVDSIHQEEVMDLDTASIDVAFKSGLFSLDANVNVQYKKKATEFLNHMDCNAQIRGGSGGTSSALYRAFEAKEYEKLDTLFHNWVESLKLDNDKTKNTTSIINVEVVPIWVLVDVGPAREYLRQFVLEQLETTGNRQLVNKFDKYPY